MRGDNLMSETEKKPRAAKGEGTAYETKDGKWRGYVTVDGKRKYFSASTKGEAARKRRALLNQRDTGHLVAGKVPTMATWITHWMKVTGPDRRDSTNAGYRTYIDQYILPALGSKRLDKITMDDLEKLYADLEERGFSGSTRHQTHAVIRGALKHAVWRGHVGRNVATLVKPPSVKKSRVKSLSEEDLRAIYRALDGDRWRARWHLSLDFGLRPGEAIALEWKHVNFEHRTVTVEQSIQQIRGMGSQLEEFVKTNSSRRTIALPPYMMGMLQETRDRQLREKAERGVSWRGWEPDDKPHAFCFTRADGSQLLPGFDTELWKGLLERAGVPHTRRYTARHTAASMAIADGEDIATVADMMGHANPAMTLSVYTHPVEERKRALADRAALRFMQHSEAE